MKRLINIWGNLNVEESNDNPSAFHLNFIPGKLKWIFVYFCVHGYIIWYYAGFDIFYLTE